MRSRRVLVLTLSLVMLGALNAVVGGKALTMLDNGESLELPYRHILSLFMAAIAVASLESPAPQIDQSDTGPLARARTLHLWLVFAGGLLLVWASELLTSTGEAPEAARGFVCWFGLALVMGLVTRESLAWTLPLACMFVLVWWGAPNGSPEPWNWATAPIEQPVATIVSGLVFALGATAYSLRR